MREAARGARLQYNKKRKDMCARPNLTSFLNPDVLPKNLPYYWRGELKVVPRAGGNLSPALWCLEGELFNFLERPERSTEGLQKALLEVVLQDLNRYLSMRPSRVELATTMVLTTANERLLRGRFDRRYARAVHALVKRRLNFF